MVQPSIKLQQLLSTGETQWIDLAVMPSVPIVFMGGGGFALTFTPQQGDECLVIFASRCIQKFEELRQRKVTVLLVSHDLGLVKRLSDRAAFMLEGRVVMQGTPKEPPRQPRMHVVGFSSG